VAEIVDVRWVAVAVASCRAVASPRWCRAIASHRVEQVSFRTYEGPVSFRVEEGAKWPGLTEFYSGPNLAERLFLVRPGLKPGLFDPGGTGQVPGQSGLTERGLRVSNVSRVSRNAKSNHHAMFFTPLFITKGVKNIA